MLHELQSSTTTRAPAHARVDARARPADGDFPQPDAPSGFRLVSVGDGQRRERRWRARAADQATGQLETDFSDPSPGARVWMRDRVTARELVSLPHSAPDPLYASLAMDTNHHACGSGSTRPILKQRHDFLRPDSLARRHRADRRERFRDRRAIARRPRVPVHGARGIRRAGRRRARRIRTIRHASRATPVRRTSPARSGAYVGTTRDWGNDLNLRHRPHAAEVRAEPAVSAESLRQRAHVADHPRSHHRRVPRGRDGVHGHAQLPEPVSSLKDLLDGTTLSKDIANAYPISAAWIRRRCATSRRPPRDRRTSSSSPSSAAYRTSFSTSIPTARRTVSWWTPIG